MRLLEAAANGRSLTSGYDVPSEDESEIYVFDRTGRHLETIDTITGTRLWTFGYDGDGRLQRLTNQDQLTTHVERDALGVAQAIVGPYGHRTTLGHNAAGYLTTIANPAAEAVTTEIDANGLMLEASDPLGRASTYVYNDDGGLFEAHDPAGGMRQLIRHDQGTGFLVESTTALGRSTIYDFEPEATTLARRVVSPAGLSTSSARDRRGLTTLAYPDGTVARTLAATSERFGTAAPHNASTEVQTPAGLRYVMTRTRDVEWLEQIGVPKIEHSVDTVTINGRAYTTTMDAAARQRVATTPQGRQTTSVFDEQGRTIALHPPGVHPTTMTYDAFGRLTSSTQGTRTTTYTYDSHGQLAAITAPLQRTTEFEYDAAGRRLREGLPDGEQILYAYDSAGNMTALRPPNRPDHHFDYNPVDLLAKYDPPALAEGLTRLAALWPTATPAFSRLGLRAGSTMFRRGWSGSGPGTMIRRSGVGRSRIRLGSRVGIRTCMGMCWEIR